MFDLKVLNRFKTENTPLRKSTNIELLYDLVFIFCLRKITPVVVSAAESAAITPYTYYTFCFTFVLMMQIWFYSTILMNRFGNGGRADRGCLIVNMFLLFLMSNAISEDWQNYMTYNVCWILILVNFIVHWLYRLKKFTNLSVVDKQTIKGTAAVMSTQAVIVSISSFLPSFPAQVGCAVAVLLGFSIWGINNKSEKHYRNFHHLSERCMLIIIIIFGETMISLGEVVATESNIRISLMVFAVFVVLLLIYLQEVDKFLDLNTTANGIGYMAITVWLGFTVFNMGLAFELLANHLDFFFDTQIYLGVCICAYMLSFMFFIPYNEKSARRNRIGMIARVVACAVMLLAFHIRTEHSLIGIVVAFICSAMVLAHDRMVHRDTPSNLGVKE